MFKHLSCFTLHYKICWKDSVLPCNLYALPWNSLNLWIFYAMLRFPENTNLQIAYVIVDDTDVYQPHGSLFFLSNSCSKCFVLCDIQFHPHNILEVKSIIIPILQKRTLRHQAMMWQVSLTSSRRSQETNPSGLVLELMTSLIPYTPLLYLMEEVLFLIQGFPKKYFSVQHLPW